MNIFVAFVFQVKNCNGSMSIDIQEGEKILFSGRDLNEGTIDVNIRLAQWPTKLSINLSNKQNNDTQCDSQGIIIKDKSIEVIAISINGFPLHIDLLDLLFDCQREGSSEISHENYWGFNGKVIMHLHSRNPMRYLLSYNNQFDITKLCWNDNE